MDVYPHELGISDLTDLLQKNSGAIRKLLNKMKKDGQVEALKRGQYRAVPAKAGHSAREE